MYQFEDIEVLVRRPAEGGDWEAVALQMFVVTYGETLTEALSNLRDAIETVIHEDVHLGLNPFDRDKAPEELLRAFHRVKGTGIKVPTAVVDAALRRSPAGVPTALTYATTLQAWAWVPAAQESPPVDVELEPCGTRESVAIWQEAA